MADKEEEKKEYDGTEEEDPIEGLKKVSLHSLVRFLEDRPTTYEQERFEAYGVRPGSYRSTKKGGW